MDGDAPSMTSSMYTSDHQMFDDVDAPPSSNGLVGRPVRHRAPRACLACRARKVRCDVTQFSGAPCTNCRLDEKECVVRRRARRTFIPPPYDPANDMRLSTTPSDPTVQDDAGAVPTSVPAFAADEILMMEDLPQPPSAPENTDSASPPQIQETLASLPDWLAPTEEPPVQQVVSQQDENAWQAPSLQNFAAPVPPTAVPAYPGTTSSIFFSHYPFMENDILWRLPQEDVALLEQRRCLHVPGRPAIEDFVREFFKHVNPYLPTIDEAEFWDKYTSTMPPPKGVKRTSLFLLQAVMFAACPFVPLSILRTLGFSSIRQARKDFYTRAKTLFDIDTTKDDFSTAQGCLLLTYHVPSTNSRMNTYWLTNAIHFARSARADQFAQFEQAGDRELAKNLKRLWWCCILRDRVMSLSLRRPMQVRPSDFDASTTLTEHDFRDDLRRAGLGSYNVATKRLFMQWAVSLCELGVVLNDVLEILYPMRARVDPVDRKRELAAVRSSMAALDRWHEKTLANFRVATSVPGTHKKVHMLTHMMGIYYFTAKAGLCNRVMLLSVGGRQDDYDRRTERIDAQKQLEGVLRLITGGLGELKQLGMLTYLPNTFIGFSTLPFVWNILDAQFSSTNGQSTRTCHALKIYAEVMTGFQSRYEITDDVIRYINKLVKHARVDKDLSLLLKNPTSPSSSSPASSPETAAANGTNFGPARATTTNAISKRDTLGDIVVRHPHSYLRLAFMIDMSLSRGQFPAEKELPKLLQPAVSASRAARDVPPNNRDRDTSSREMGVVQASARDLISQFGLTPIEPDGTTEQFLLSASDAAPLGAAQDSEFLSMLPFDLGEEDMSGRLDVGYPISTDMVPQCLDDLGLSSEVWLL